MSVTINGTSGVTFNDASTQNTAATGFGFKNRIINGAMVIDQRNAGASITANGSTYAVDRFTFSTNLVSKATAQRSTTAPTGFINSLLVTSSAATSLASGDYFSIKQPIEGFNCADLNWGATAASAGQTAATVTISFWVRSSLTGTFGGALNNSANNRSYPFSYTISSADTWEQKSITIAGDTSGTWLTDNGAGIQVRFALGMGSTYSGTAGAWVAGDIESVTGAVNVLGTNGATFYITGVQLEKGSTATSFDYRPYGTELALCQRYYQKSFPQSTAPADNQTGQPESGFFAYDTASGQSQFTQFIVTMRNSPTMTFYQANARGSTAGQWATYDGSSWTSLSTSSAAAVTLSQNGFTFVGSRSGAFTGRSAYLVSGHYTASSEL